MKIGDKIAEILNNIYDPEIPVISIIDLGMIGEIVEKNNIFYIDYFPTYSGCPASDYIKDMIERELKFNQIDNFVILTKISPAWNTNLITAKGKLLMKNHGISPPTNNDQNVICPQCDSANSQVISLYGSTACKSLYKCNDCMEVFEYFKCLK